MIHIEKQDGDIYIAAETKGNEVHMWARGHAWGKRIDIELPRDEVHAWARALAEATAPLPSRPCKRYGRRGAVSDGILNGWTCA